MPRHHRALAELYFRSQVAGQAGATIEAKRRDLGRFLAFYCPKAQAAGSVLEIRS